MEDQSSSMVRERRQKTFRWMSVVYLFKSPKFKVVIVPGGG